MAVTVNNLVGSWRLDHDGWTGTLVFNPPDQSFDQVDGACLYHYTRIDGTWSGGSGANLPVHGTFGGKDGNRRAGETCPTSGHKVVFTIAFPGAPPQPFEGYVFTHDVRTMAGYTWWQGMPFAWFASKL